MLSSIAITVRVEDCSAASLCRQHAAGAGATFAM